MSNNIRRYPSIPCDDCCDASDELSLTATMQGEYGDAIQFTIGGKFAVLSPNQLKDMIKVITYRLNCIEGYSATDDGVERTVKPKKVKP